MARKNINVDPSVKHFESYTDFSGGLVTDVGNEKLRDNEFTIFENVDILNRASAQRRSGRRKIDSIPGKGQGLFWFYRQGQDDPDMIAAISGKLYVKKNGEDTFSYLRINDVDDSEFSFQDALPIEAVQYRKVLFVATGTKIVEVTFDGTDHKADVMLPYKPTVQEIINIGTNAIADDPSTWIQGKEAPDVAIEGITTSTPQGEVNKSVRFTAHVNKPVNVDVNYTFYTRKTGAGTFTTRKTNSPDNFVDVSFNEIGGYDIKVDTRKVVYPLSTWDINHEGWVNGIRGTTWDSADNEGCLVLKGTAVNPNDASLKSWRDFPTPLDMSKADRIEWWWTVFTSSTQSGLDNNEVQLKFYTEGNLSTPILTVGNVGGKGRGLYNMYNDPPQPIPSSYAWKKETSNYDSTIAGLNKIVRIGISGGKVSINGTYVPGDGSWTIDPSDTTSRFDDIIIWKSGTEVSYTKSNFEVVGVIDPQYDPETYSAIHTSRSIRLHYDRLVLAKDNKYPGNMYFSDLNNPRYFPTNKRLDFSLDRQEGITAITRFKDYLVVFTKTTISLLLGSAPVTEALSTDERFRPKMIHDRIGCVADQSAKVVNNSVLFLGDDGIYTLNANSFQINDLNVKRIDQSIQSQVVKDQNSCAIVQDNQYWLCQPSAKTIWRLHYDTGAWVKDTSNKLNITQFLSYTDDIFNLTDDGNIYVHDKSVFDDDGDAYTTSISSKYLDLSESFNLKKLRRLYVLARHYNSSDVNLYVRVYADAQIVLNPEKGEAVVNPDTGYVEWQTTVEPNMEFYGSTEFGKWKLGKSPFGEIPLGQEKTSVRGKCQRVMVSVVHNEPVPFELYGFGLEFKVKGL